MCDTRRVGSRVVWSLALVLIVNIFGVQAQAQYAGGSGTASDPYQIWTAGQLNIGSSNNLATGPFEQEPLVNLQVASSTVLSI